MNKKKDTKIESKGDTIKVVLLIAVLIILLLAIGMVIYVNAIKPNKKIETPKHDEPTNEPSKQVEPNKVIEENNNEEIASVKVEIPTEKNGEPSYIEKNYTKENIPSNLSTMLKNLKLDEEVLPYGIGFESSYIIDVNSKIKYVLLDSGKLCDLNSSNCYTSTYDVKNILDSLK